MATKKVTEELTRRLATGCCGVTSRVAQTSDLPAGWTTAVAHIELMPGTGKSSKGIELCPACSKDVDAAIARHEASWTHLS